MLKSILTKKIYSSKISNLFQDKKGSFSVKYFHTADMRATPTHMLC